MKAATTKNYHHRFLIMMLMKKPTDTHHPAYEIQIRARGQRSRIYG
jgi:hypothetical protein